MYHTRLTRRQNAFTLVEMLLVLVILAVLAAIVVPKLSGNTQKAKSAAAKTQISGFQQALATYEIEHDGYPKDLNALTAPRADSNGNALEPLFTVIPPDPWGTAYVYTYPGRNNPGGYDLMSAGQDMRAGTEDDITNWGKGK